MGWNSWDSYGTTVTEAEVLANARFMAEHLLDAGWDTLVIDIDWYDPTARAHGYNENAPLILDEYGRQLPDPQRFYFKNEGGKNVIVEFKKEDKLLIFKLTEDVDQHTSEKIRRKMDNEIKRYIPRKVIFDFSNISFMDSAGIGMVLGRYKLAQMLDGELEIINVNKSMKKIFDMSGVSRIINIIEEEKNERVI